MKAVQHECASASQTTSCDLAVFLASDDAGYLTGEIIFASGGHK
jgi:hypothetical protein